MGSHLVESLVVCLLFGAFAELLKATVNFIMYVRPSVCLSVRMEKLGVHCTDFHEILYLSVLRKYFDKF